MPRVTIVYSGPGRGHLSRSNAMRDAFLDLGCECEVTDVECEGPFVLHDTPERPLLGRPLRRAFWKRGVYLMGSGPNPDIRPRGIKWMCPKNLDAEGLAELMRHADVFITNGGQSLNEALSFSKPVFAIQNADDQEENILHGNRHLLDWARHDDPDLKDRVEAALDSWVDQGIGIAESLLCSLRQANLKDAMFVLDVRNYAADFSFTGHVTPGDHITWMREACRFPNRFHIVTCFGRDAGYLRISDGEVSVALHPDYQGQGLSPFLMELVRRFGDLTARVMPGNTRAQAMFAKAGFTLEREDADEALYALRHARHEA